MSFYKFCHAATQSLSMTGGLMYLVNAALAAQITSELAIHFTFVKLQEK